jgi:hypothetical protein
MYKTIEINLRFIQFHGIDYFASHEHKRIFQGCHVQFFFINMGV